MEKELIKLYRQYLRELDTWNRSGRDPFNDEQEPEFETFMKWLMINTEQDEVQS